VPRIPSEHLEILSQYSWLQADACTADYHVYDSSFCPNLDLLPIPKDRWLGILKRFQSASSLPEMAVYFVAFNEPELMGKGMAIHGLRE
jgi:hypothetical protein